MTIQCPQCGARYRIDDTQVAGKAEAKVRCTQCNLTFGLGLGSPGSSRPQAKRESSWEAPAPWALSDGLSAALAVTHGALKGNVYPVSKPRVILGRSGADIVVDDAEVSRQHCALKINGSGALLTDLGSTNGTFVKNERIHTCTLQHLDEFRIGTTTLMLTLMPKR